MNPLFLLFLLGLTTYFIVRGVSSVSRTPTWLLWLVAMMPASIWIGWTLANDKKTPPFYLIFIPLVVCLTLYFFLIQWGRIPTSEASSSANRELGASLSEEGELPKEQASLRPIDQSEERYLQACFPWSIYYLQNLEYRPQAVICRGHLKSQPEVAYQTIRANVEEKFGDRFLVVFQEGVNGKPFFALVTNPHAKGTQSGQSTFNRPVIALSLLAATFFTACLAWLQIGGSSSGAGNFGQGFPISIIQGIPYAIALLTILGVHELAHYLAARRHHIRTTLPYFIPVLPLPWFPFGTFGAFIQIRSPIPNRRALFDVGISGPLVGFAVALPLLIWGLAHSTLVALPATSEFLNFQAFDPKFSLLLTILSKITLGGTLTADTALKMHPVAVASSLGLIVTAFNLMPVGQLDGGHIVHAMLGQRMGAIVGQIARLFLLVLSYWQRYLLLWAIILFLMPAMDEPALNDVTELDNRRDLWGVVSLALLLLIILPAPKFLTTLLNM
ncbi:site-2 protease family protein [Phormidium sp. CLA17]|uniref:site-2 protease family protein n=1 Tax=Leptolyngbya sp. Cla-17 TaxID=2803751 RepID=UPI001491A2B3|nr:site-2 protease family protein [Leptolyngbya sp. Cla-17]MBM0742190.1 site-2 protease family protein [Leptolyngbya sp. Cla-17]